MDRDGCIRIAEAMNRRNREEQARLDRRIAERAGRAWQEIERLVGEFRAVDPELEMVVVFGSLAGNRMRDDRFDLDMAIRSRNYLGCLSVALDSEFKVDLVDLDTANSVLMYAIEHYGKVVYHAKKD